MSAPGPAGSPGGRQRLAVLFSDLCNSTGTSGRLEAEELAELLQQVRQVWRRVAAPRGGEVLRMQGDGALIVFGLQGPGEDDGRSAVETALDIETALQGLGLRSHAGVHAGVLLVTEGDSERGRLDLVGEVPNLAAHLAGQAQPGEIVVSLEALGPHAAGFEAEPLPATPGLPAALRVRGRRTAQGGRRFEAARRRGLAPLVGRQGPRERLRAFLFDAAEAQRCALLTGLGGMGKTRLLSELMAEPGAAALQLLSGSCEPGAAPLQAFRDALGLDLDTSAEALQAALLQRLSTGESRLLLDDWQWADDASRALLLRLLQAAPAGLRVLIASRPDERGETLHPAGAGALRVDLQALDLHECQALTAGLLPGLDPFSVARVHTHSGGLPLYIEELCHLLRASGGSALLALGQTPQHWGQGLVAARVARLPAALSELLGACAVLGQRQPAPLLAVAAGRAVAAEEMDALVEADFLRPEAEGQWQFKHGITREAVYQGMALAARRAAHARLLQAVAAQQPQAVETLAEHARGAANWPVAVEQAERAGDAAAALMALDRARRHYLDALDALDRQGGELLRRRWCELGAKLGMVCLFDPLALGDDTRPFERALALARSLGDVQLEAQAGYWLAYQHYGSGRLRRGLRSAGAALEAAARAGATRLQVQIQAAQGQLLAAAGAYDDALRLLDEAVQRKREQGARGRSGAAAVGSAYALACAASVRADRGDFAAAHADLAEALGLIEGLQHPICNSVWNWQAVVLNWEGRWPEALAVAERSVRQAEATGALLLLAVSSAAAGFAAWASATDAAGREAGLQRLRRAQQWIESRGGRFYTSIYLGWLAQACAVQGLQAEARRHAAGAFWRAREGERLGEAQAARALAWLAQQQGDAAAEARWLQRAEASAQQRGSVREQALNAALRERRAHVAEPWFRASAPAD